MRKTFLSTLAILLCLTVFAKERIVEKPVYTLRNNKIIEFERVTLSDTATVLDVNITFIPKNWIQFSQEPFLEAGGVRYNIRYGDGITLGEKFWMPETGKATVKLIFPPLPQNTKVFNFFESEDVDNGWTIWGIRTDGKLPAAKIDKQWMSEKMPAGETLPAPRYEKGNGTLSGKILGYEPTMGPTLKLTRVSPFDMPDEVPLKVAADGTFQQEIPLYGTSLLTLSVGGTSCNFYMEPDGKTEILINLPEIGRQSSALRKAEKSYGEKIYFKGNYAGINNLYQKSKSILPNNMEETNALYTKIEGKTPSEYVAYWLGRYDEELNKIKQIEGITPAGVELLSLPLQNDIMQMVSRGPYYLTQAYKKANGIGPRERLPKEYTYPRYAKEDFDFLSKFNLNNAFYPNTFFSAQMLTYEGAFKPAVDPNGIFKFLIASGKLKADETAFLNQILRDGMETVQKQEADFQNKIMKIRNTYDALFQEYGHALNKNSEIHSILKSYYGTAGGPLFSSMATMDYARKLNDYTLLTEEDFSRIKELKDPCALAYFTDKNQQLINKIEENKKKTGYTIAKLPEVPADQLVDAIIAQYPGKVLFIDFWATWCGPCKSAMKQAEPVKAALADKGIVYIYLAGENSPLKAWENMIPDIHGIHYRMSGEQWTTVCNKYKVSGVPSYLIIGKDGKQVHFQTGFMGADGMKKMLLREAAK